MRRITVLLAIAMLWIVGCGEEEKPTTFNTEESAEDTIDESVFAAESETAAKALVRVPYGFRVFKSWRGITLYIRDYGGRRGYSPDYVAVVDLNNASISQLTGRVIDAPGGKIYKKTIGQFWNDAGRKPAVMASGTFFDQNRNPTPIPFGLKVDGRTISYGSRVCCEYPGQIKLLAIDQYRRSWIVPYVKRYFHYRALPDIVGGLDAGANKSRSSSVARTFIGVSGTKTVMIFSSKQATQALADGTLREFGCHNTVMLDGGGSTGLIADGDHLISSSRPIPHVIAVYPDGGGASGSW